MHIDQAVMMWSSLILLQRFLLAQKPRTVTAAMSQMWIVFTDASFEQASDSTDSSDVAGFGGVLVSPHGPPVSFFAFELKGDNLKYLNPAGKKTAICQCEFFAVVVALKSLVNNCPVDRWSSMLIMMVLEMCSSPVTADPVGSVLSTNVLELEGALAISSWFTRVPFIRVT